MIDDEGVRHMVKLLEPPSEVEGIEIHVVDVSRHPVDRDDEQLLETLRETHRQNGESEKIDEVANLVVEAVRQRPITEQEGCRSQ
ncbi:MAG: hypothetical protein ACYDGN_16875 [Acidimicrobiales bacterium]